MKKLTTFAGRTIWFAFIYFNFLCYIFAFALHLCAALTLWLLYACPLHFVSSSFTLWAYGHVQLQHCESEGVEAERKESRQNTVRRVVNVCKMVALFLTLSIVSFASYF